MCIRDRGLRRSRARQPDRRVGGDPAGALRPAEERAGGGAPARHGRAAQRSVRHLGEPGAEGREIDVRKSARALRPREGEQVLEVTAVRTHRVLRKSPLGAQMRGEGVERSRAVSDRRDLTDPVHGSTVTANLVLLKCRM